jgi:hypothetical protein
MNSATTKAMTIFLLLAVASGAYAIGATHVSVPEPGSMLLLGSGIAAMALVRRFRRKK